MVNKAIQIMSTCDAEHKWVKKATYDSEMLLEWEPIQSTNTA